MATGRVFVNHLDIGQYYNIALSEDGYIDLLTLPSLKAVDVVKWEEYDGEEPDLIFPALEPRNITLPFFCLKQEGVDAFLADVQTKVYSGWQFRDLGIYRNFRFVSIEYSPSSYTGEIHLVDDIGQWWEDGEGEVSIPLGDTIPYRKVETFIDGKTLWKYNMEPMEGFRESLLAPPSQAEKMIISSAFFPGQRYGINNTDLDQPPITKDSKEVSLPYAIKLPKSLIGYVLFYEILHRFAGPGEHILTYDTVDYPFRYISSSVEHCTIRTTEIFIIFTLKLQILR